MEEIIVNLLLNNGIIKNEEDFKMFKLSNANPIKNNVIGIFSKIRNKNYVIKKCNHSEIANLRLASRLFLRKKIKNVEILMPIGNIKDVYLFEYSGLPLNKRCPIVRGVLFKNIVYISNLFLESGYLWGGLALRNFFYSNGKYVLIDFEKLFKIKNKILSRRHLLFLRINLIQSFNKKTVDKYISFLEEQYIFSNKIRKMDRVEKIGWRTLSFRNRDKFLNYFDTLTVNAEEPLGKDNNPFKIGHIVDELVSAEISFLWTLMMYKKRTKDTRSFKQLLNITNKVIESGNEEKIRFHLAGMIITNGDVKKYKRVIRKIDEAKRYNVAEKYDDIMKNIVEAACGLVGDNFESISIIARGSYGECILTNKSDLDFEIVRFENNRIHPVTKIENLVCEILNYLGIMAEGTKGRPKEKDVMIGVESRDLFEIFELRLIFGNKTTFFKYLQEYKKVVYESALWKNNSEYENSKRVRSLKSVFEDARFIIDRLALMNNKKITSPKVFEKIRICPADTRKELRVILRDLIYMRNGNVKDVEKYKFLDHKLKQIKVEYKLPIC